MGEATWLEDFVRESNRIEGIRRPPKRAEIVVSQDFLALSDHNALSLAWFVAVCQPGARIRDTPGMNVYVGDHVPPPGGPGIRRQLEEICEAANFGRDPHLLHHAYETLHPFTDGNGRSGRILWLWGMKQVGGDEFERVKTLGFLHSWYYQSLSAGPFRPAAEREGDS